MFEHSGVEVTTVQHWTAALAGAPITDDDTAMIEEIRALEELVCAA